MHGVEALPEMRFPGLSRWYHISQGGVALKNGQVGSVNNDK